MSELFMFEYRNIPAVKQREVMLTMLHLCRKRRRAGSSIRHVRNILNKRRMFTKRRNGSKFRKILLKHRLGMRCSYVIKGGNT